MVDELLLLSGEDIPFLEAQVSIHQPRIREIAMISENDFFAGAQFLQFSKNQLSDLEKKGLENHSDFDVFMMVMNAKQKVQYRNSVIMLLTLLFPEYKISFMDTNIMLINQNNSSRIDNTNYDIFKNIVKDMFELGDLKASKDYDPYDKRAEKIAEKLKKSKERVAKIKGIEEKGITLLSRYVSILSVGLQLDVNTILNYTVFQLKDAFKRYNRKQEYDLYVKGKLAGAQDLDDVENWMGDIHLVNN